VSIGTALAEWRACYRDPFLLATAAVVGIALVLLGVRTWHIRRRARRIAEEPPLLPNNNDKPIACTLASSDRKVRLSELAELSQSALAGARREDLALYLQYFPEAEERVRQMVKKEQECCAFLEFEVEPRSNCLALRITAPEAAREAIQDIYAQFVKS
jgi:hypothetical protein